MGMRRAVWYQTRKQAGGLTRQEDKQGKDASSEKEEGDLGHSQQEMCHMFFNKGFPVG